LAAYDLGASATLLQSIYDSEKTDLLPIDPQLNGKTILEINVPDITDINWTKWLGDSKSVMNYSCSHRQVNIYKATMRLIFHFSLDK